MVLSGASLWCRPCCNLWQQQQMPKNYDNIKVDFFIVEQILAFASTTNLVREVKSLSPNWIRTA